MLTDATCRNAKCPPDSKQKKFYDAGGLFLLVTPNGSKLWRWKYRIRAKEKLFTLGSYPEISLAQARSARDAQKLIKENGQDPSAVRKQAKLKCHVDDDTTFKAIALKWYNEKKDKWGDHHAVREKRNLEKDLFPYLGSLSIESIQPTELLGVLKKVEKRGSIDVAHRVLTTARNVWDYAISEEVVKNDITAKLRPRLQVHVGRHFAAIIEPVELGALLRAIDVYQGSVGTKAALQLTPILFQRPGEIRGMEWSEIDFERELWTIPSMRMKRWKAQKLIGKDHIVPLPRQAVEILKNLHVHTGHGALVFPGQRFHDRPISDNTLRAALAALGYGPETQSVHGFRATARTILAEVLDVDILVIEAHLAHVVRDTNGSAYNRTNYLEKRIQMVQKWADYLDQCRQGAVVIQLSKLAA